MSYYHDDDGADEALSEFMRKFFMRAVIACALAIALALLLSWIFDPVKGEAQTKEPTLRCETLIVTAEASTVSCTDTAQLIKQSGTTMIIGGCDESLWQHTYNPQRLQIVERCASVTGTVVDATRGKQKDGCRHEADGDGHCFLKLDAGQEQYINEMNTKNEGGNLVFEPECRYRVTQADAKAACLGWKQDLKLAPVGSHVRITGAAVLDTEHGHREIHPVSSIEVLK